MLASRSNPEAGRRLKMERARVRLSTREVERMSQRIAQEKNNQEYSLSHAWLTDIENGEFTPSIYKLYSLSVIYKRHYDDILAFFGIHIRDIGREQMSLPLPRTHLIGDGMEKAGAPIVLPEELRVRILKEKTNLVSRMFKQWGGVPAALLQHMDLRRSLYGYIGMDDFTLNPLVRPGSFVEIDSSRRKIEWGEWPSVFERPIYFVELRDGYACSWCELNEKQLFLIPFPQSRSQVRKVRIPYEAEVVGRVTAVSMRLAEV